MALTTLRSSTAEQALASSSRAVLRSGQIVAVDHRDARAAQAELARERVDAPRRARRIGGAEVADDADAVPQAARQDGPQQSIEQRLVAALGVLAARELRERERALGERLEDQERRPARRDERVDHADAASVRSPEKPAAQPILRTSMQAI